MFLLITSFFSSLILILLTIRYRGLHERFSGDHDLNGPQKFHQESIPRIGGLCIYAALWITNIVAYFKDSSLGSFLSHCLIAALPIWTLGFMEDITKSISIKARLIASFISGALILILFDITSIQIGIWGLDNLLMNKWVTGFFLCFAIAGLSNAYNIIDGLNGLASMTGVIATIIIALVAFKVGDFNLLYLSIILISALLGFFIFNYPKGLIFLGDGGAYLTGFLIATMSVLLVQRNPTVSPWFALIVNFYPVFETIFTIWRRKFYRGRNSFLPDGGHFHSLIYKRTLRRMLFNEREKINSCTNYLKSLSNAKSTPYLWFVSIIGVIPALLFWRNTLFLIISGIVLIFAYTYLYKSIINQREPWWLFTMK